MEFITLDAQDYETALTEARTTYGTSVRVHTRNDYQTKKGLKKESRCTITFYLVKESIAEDEILQDHLESIESRVQIDPLKTEEILSDSSEDKETKEPMGTPLNREITTSKEANITKETKETKASIETIQLPPIQKHLDTLIEGEEHQRKLLRNLLEENDFTEGYIQDVMTKLLTDRQFGTLQELEMALLEHIIESVTINHSLYTKPKQFFVLLGPTG
ncbi:MAG TPA: hypothetical protein VJ863_00430, partial [Sphaerochaeta sp.]|nr:hypothetical protein [Sphaerochaeta sp.]